MLVYFLPEDARGGQEGPEGTYRTLGASARVDLACHLAVVIRQSVVRQACNQREPCDPVSDPRTRPSLERMYRSRDDLPTQPITQWRLL